MDEVEKKFFSQFPNPWALRVSGMGGYTSKCEKKSKSLHPIIHIFPGSVHIFPPAEKADPSWEYIIRTQTHECGNWD